MLSDAQTIALIPTTDLERAKRFYGETLGLIPRGASEYALQFDAGGVRVRVSLTRAFGRQPFAIAGWQVEGIESKVRALQERDVEVVRYGYLDQDELGIWTAPGGDRVAWFRDPDGSLLSLTEAANAANAANAGLSTTPGAVVEFWLGPLDEDGLAKADYAARWWMKDAKFDEALRQRFALAHAQAVAGRLESWCTTPRGRLALVIVLDQFSRNMFRGRPGMFASDAQARELVLETLENGQDAELLTVERAFLYMPLMHSEQLEHQERALGLFEALASQGSPRVQEHASGNLKAAQAHRDIIARFGRFPHRNAILERQSTEDELTFLKQPGSSF